MSVKGDEEPVMDDAAAAIVEYAVQQHVEPSVADDQGDQGVEHEPTHVVHDAADVEHEAVEHEAVEHEAVEHEAVQHEAAEHEAAEEGHVDPAAVDLNTGEVLPGPPDGNPDINHGIVFQQLETGELVPYLPTSPKRKRAEKRKHDALAVTGDRAAYVPKRKFALDQVKKIDLQYRKLFCVAEVYKYLEAGRARQDAFRMAAESVGTSSKSAAAWVDDWERRGDGQFSPSQRGKHAKSPWLLQAPELQQRARDWLEEHAPREGQVPPRGFSLSRQFQEFCNNELLVGADLPAPPKGKKRRDEDRKISQKTARTWLQRLGYSVVVKE